MRYFLLLFLLLGCESGIPRLHNVRSVTIEYARNWPPEQYRHLKVSDAKEVRALVDAFRVRSTKAGARAAFPPGMVEFHLGDGSSVQCWFEAADVVTYNGHEVYLADRAFCDRVNDLLSRKEGQAVDILNGFWKPHAKAKEAK